MISSGQRILRSTALIMGLTLVGKVTGLLKDIIVAAHFGTSMQMDAFLVAVTIVSLMFIWLRNPIQVLVVPLFTEELASRGERSAWENFSVLVNTAILFFLVFATIGWFFSPLLVRLVAPGFADETKVLSVNLSRLLMLTLVFLGTARLFSGIYQSYRSFGRPGITSAVDNLVVIPSLLLLTPLFGIQGLAISTVLGTAAEAIFQAPILWKNRAHYKLHIDWKNPILRRMAWMGVPLLIGTGGDGLDNVIDRAFASLLPSGSLSALAYGNRLTYATFQLFVTSFTTVLFPFFSMTAGLENYQDLGKKLFKSLTALFWIVLPLSLGILILSEPLVRLVYHRGAFNEESVRITSQAVLFYAIGLSANSLSNVLSYAFYSLKDTKTPITTGLLRLGVKFALSFALVGVMAHSGLALAESLSWVVKAVLLFFLLPKERLQIDYRKLFQSFATTTLITLAMGGTIYSVLEILGRTLDLPGSFMVTSMQLGIAVGVGVGSYFVFSLFMQPAELNDLLKLARAGFAKR